MSISTTIYWEGVQCNGLLAKRQLTRLDVYSIIIRHLDAIWSRCLNQGILLVNFGIIFYGGGRDTGERN